MRLKIRDLLEKPIVGHLDQGYIFYGAKSELYLNKEVYGIIITPRCDIAQKKSPEYHYLPVVKFEDWKTVEFPELFCKRLDKETSSRIKEQLIKLSISPSIISTFSTKEAKDILRQQSLKKGDFESINEKIQILELVDKFYGNNDPNVFEQLIKANSGCRKTIIKELLSNKLPGYYIVEMEETHFIVRLKELKRIQSKVFFKIGEGLECADLQEEDLIDSDLIKISDNEMIFPLYVLRSPFIEHLIQCFVQLFARVGIEDIDENTCDYILKEW